MKFIDYYKVLGLDDSASADDIKHAYRRLARKYHPDVSKEDDAEVRFKEINEAYQVLKDPERKAEYDELKRYGGTRPDHSYTPPPGWQSRRPYDPYAAGAADGGEYVDMSDFFAEMFSRRAAAGDARGFDGGSNPFGADAVARGDQEASISVDLRQAFAGESVQLSLRAPKLHSDGSIRMEERTLRVKLPQGVRDGQRIRLAGQGLDTGNNTKGDLYITVQVTAKAPWHLDGKDVLLTLPVLPWEAALGARIEVPTLAGKVRVTVPANASNGQRLRLKGRGLPGEPPGDQFVLLNIVQPTLRTEAQKVAMEALGKLFDDDPRANLGV